MNSFSKVAFAGLLLALPLPMPASGRNDGPSRVRADDNDTVEVEAPRTRVRVRRVEGHGRIGMTLVDLTPELRLHFGAPRDAGAMIGSIEKDSPGHRAGLEVGDIVTSVDGESVSSPWELARRVARKETGEAVKLEIVRNRAFKAVSVKVEERERRDGDGDGDHGDLGELGHLKDFGHDMGRMGRELGREIRREMGTRPFHFDFDNQAFAMPRRDDVRKLRERVEDLEKRLKDLENRRLRSLREMPSP